MNETSDEEDVYYQRAKQEGWRARSAYKLLHIDYNFEILKDVTRAVDLCAAPGSWSQVLSNKLYLGRDVHRPPTFLVHEEDERKRAQCKVNKDVKIVAVDKMKMIPLEGVTQLRGDIMDYSTAQEIIRHFDGTKADLVLCDGAPEITGTHCIDVYMQSKLLLGALHIAFNVLRHDGVFVAKIFHDGECNLLKLQLHIFFASVSIFKPSSSRNNNNEFFVICRRYRPPDGFDPTKLTPYLNSKFNDFDELTGVNKFIIPFLLNGNKNLSELDTTVRLQLETDYPFLSTFRKESFHAQNVNLTPQVEQQIKKLVNGGKLITKEHVEEYEKLKKAMCEPCDKNDNQNSKPPRAREPQEFDEYSFAIIKWRNVNNMNHRLVPKILPKFETTIAKDVGGAEDAETKTDDGESNFDHSALCICHECSTTKLLDPMNSPDAFLEKFNEMRLKMIEIIEKESRFVNEYISNVD